MRIGSIPGAAAVTGPAARDVRPELAQLFVVVSWASTFILTRDVLDHGEAFGPVKVAGAAVRLFGLVLMR